MHISKEMLRINSCSLIYCTILTFIKFLQLWHAMFKWAQTTISFLRASRNGPAALALAEPVCLKVKNSILQKQAIKSANVIV